MTLCRFELADGVARLTLDSPDNHNALGLDISTQLRDHLARCADDPQVRVVVIAATGGVFSSGWDVKPGATDGLHVDSIFVEILEMIRLGAQPVVAEVAGHALGGVVGLIAACDISVASSNVRFGFPEARLGLAPTTAAVHCVPKMRPVDALELMLTAERFSAQRAADIGLITRCVEPDQLSSTVTSFTESMLRGGPKALAACKHLARSITSAGPDAYALAAAYNGALVGSDEATEGIAAFAEKRDPAWLRHR